MVEFGRGSRKRNDRGCHSRWWTFRSRLALIGVAALAALGGITAYTVTREVRNVEPGARAQAPVSPGDGRLDTSQPDWDKPLRDEEAAKPRYPQTVNGIRLLPGTGDPSVAVCKPGEAEWAAEAEADASPLGIGGTALPAGAALDPAMSDSVKCGGRIVVIERFYVIPSEPGLSARIASGVSWFDTHHGGYIWVTRMVLTGSAWDGSDVPSGQWSSSTINGLPAAVGKPMLDGFAHSSVVVWDPSSGVLTAVRALDRSLDEVVTVAQELTK
jgi:hypothetical protein